MAQVSLYFDDKTEKRLRKAARISGVSVSKWVRNTVEKSLEKDWPENFFKLFGSIQDSSFEEVTAPSAQDTKREDFA